MQSLKNWPWIVALSAGFCCCLAVAFFLWHRHQEDVDLYSRAAKNLHMDVAPLKQELQLLDKAQLKGYLSPQDWSQIEHYFYSNNLGEQSFVTAILRYAYIPPERRDEALRMVRQFIGQHPEQTTAVEVYDLYKLNDPSWKAEGIKLLHGSGRELEANVYFFKATGLMSKLTQ